MYFTLDLLFVKKSSLLSPNFFLYKTNRIMDIKDIQNKVVKVSDIYAKKCNIKRDNDWYMLKLQEEIGELTQIYLTDASKGRNRGVVPEELKQDFANELSDVIGQVLLIANHHNIDIEEALERKWFRNLV